MTLEESWVLGMCMMVGTMMWAVVSSLFTAMVVGRTQNHAAFFERIQDLRAYMTYRRFPVALRTKILEYYRQLYEKNLVFNEEEVVSSLSPPLQRALAVHNARGIINSVPILHDARMGFINTLIPCLQNVISTANEVVIVADEPSCGIFFIGTGVVSQFRALRLTTTFSPGSFFGETAVVWPVQEPFTVRTDTDCDFYVLSKVNFTTLTRDYPDIEQLFRTVNLKRLQEWDVDDVVDGEGACLSAAPAFFDQPFIRSVESLYDLAKDSAIRRTVSAGAGAGAGTDSRGTSALDRSAAPTLTPAESMGSLAGLDVPLAGSPWHATGRTKPRSRRGSASSGGSGDGGIVATRRGVSMVDMRPRHGRERGGSQEEQRSRDDMPLRSSSLRKFWNMLPRRRARTSSNPKPSEPGSPRTSPVGLPLGDAVVGAGTGLATSPPASPASMDFRREPIAAPPDMSLQPMILVPAALTPMSLAPPPLPVDAAPIAPAVPVVDAAACTSATAP